MLINNGVLEEVKNSDVKQGFFEVPSGVEVLGKECFNKAKKLRKLYIPSTVSTILSDTFKNNRSIKEINIPKYDYEQNWSNCRNLKVINIDYSMKKEDFSFSFKKPKRFKKINFIFENKVMTIKGKKVTKIMKSKSGSFLFIGAKDKDKKIITKDKIVNFDLEKTMEKIDSIDYFDFEKNYLSLIDDNFDIFYEWIKIIESNRRLKNEKILDEEFLLSIPANSKDMTDFYINYKKLKKVIDKFSFTRSSDIISVIKMCYVLGFFTNDFKDDLENLISELSQNNNTTNTFFITRFNGMKIEKHGYDKEFAQFVFDNYENIKTRISGLYYNGYNELNDVYNSFDLIKKELKKESKSITLEEVLKKASAFKYVVREGNEELYNYSKQYSDEYSAEDFELLQDLYEKAKKIAKINSKKIIKTIDKEEKYKYEWLEGDDPVNLFLGNKVGCCARINKMGEGILRAGLFNDEVRNLALYGDKNKIVGKATAYYNVEGKYILFNNAEVSLSTTELERDHIFNSLVRAVNDQLEILNDDDIRVTKVVIGMGNNDLRNQIAKNNYKIEKEDMKKNLLFVGGTNGVRIVYEGDATRPYLGQCVLWEHEKQKVK